MNHMLTSTDSQGIHTEPLNKHVKTKPVIDITVFMAAQEGPLPLTSQKPPNSNTSHLDMLPLLRTSPNALSTNKQVSKQCLRRPPASQYLISTPSLINATMLDHIVAESEIHNHVVAKGHTLDVCPTVNIHSKPRLAIPRQDHRPAVTESQPLTPNSTHSVNDTVPDSNSRHPTLPGQNTSLNMIPQYSTPVKQLLHSAPPHSDMCDESWDVDDALNDIIFHPYVSIYNSRDINTCRNNALTHPHSLAWIPPTPMPHFPETYAQIYSAVSEMDTPNMVSHRQQIPSGLIIEAWKQLTTGNSDDEFVLNGVQYGFPLEFLGPSIPTNRATENHTSARYYPKEVEEYIQKELNEGALLGPFISSPFTECHISPLMTRPKATEGERRIIVDLSFPDGGINKWVVKGMSQGKSVKHKLPTINMAVQEINSIGIDNAWLSAIDISRAYRNFRTCPKDWPLLGISHAGSTYIDIALPFGARMSSYYMQRAADFICRALKMRGITALMYLDDLLIVSNSKHNAEYHHSLALEILQGLGLPIAFHKLTYPTKSLVWLGISINTILKTLSIPQRKLDEIRQYLQSMASADNVPLKSAQRAIGLINHLAKCVHPARLFMSRILAQIRSTYPRTHIPISKQVKADLDWFHTFLADYNGKSMITTYHASNIISADACASGFGAFDHTTAYSIKITTNMAKYSSTQLECINCLLAIRTFISKKDRGTTIVLRCDNMPSVFSYAHGRAKDVVLAACARAAWHHIEQCGARVVYQHMPGVEMEIADALSRWHLAHKFQKIAKDSIRQLRLKLINPIFTNVDFSAFM